MAAGDRRRILPASPYRLTSGSTGENAPVDDGNAE